MRNRIGRFGMLLLAAAGLAPSVRACADTILHAFQGNGNGHTDGGSPVGLTPYAGSLYGVTQNGGTTGNGTLFRIDAAGQYRILYDFQTGKDAEIPSSLLVTVNGIFYGLTLGGGAYGQGALFAVTPEGSEHVVYSFKGSTDGSFPQGNLAYLGGALYGTTSFGGAAKRGTVFSLTLGGQHRVLHSFAGGSDGGNPSSGLTLVGRNFVGTTELDGSPTCSSQCGTLFIVSSGGNERVVYRFSGGGDGGDPFAPLTLAYGAVYGTTRYGGDLAACDAGCGTVFRVVADGTLTTLYRFKGGADGALPAVQLVAGNGVLYGATVFDGTANGGTAFALTTSGQEMVLHEFEDGDDGWEPSSVLFANKKLFGTTSFGGRYSGGTAYSLVP